MRYDAVVIGSGVSGLGAALVLARHGQRVALVEQHERIAPLLRRFKRDGCWCDPGLHYAGGLHPSGSLSVIFRYLGLSDLIRTVPMNPDGYDIIHTDNAEPLRLPVGTDRVRETLIRRYPRSRGAVTAYLDRIEAIHRTTPFLNFDLPDDAVSAKESTGLESLTAFLADHGAEAALQDMLSRYGHALCGVEGHECPLALHAVVLGSFYYSAHTFAHGGDEIVEAFQRQLDETGVDIYCGQPADRLEVDHHRRLQGVRLNEDELLECRACICTIHPHLLLDLFAPHSVRRAFLTRIRSLENTFGPFVVFLNVEDPPDDLKRSNVYFLGGGWESTAGDTSLAALTCGAADARSGRRSLCLVRPCPAALLPPKWCGKPARRDEAYEDRKQEEIDRSVELFLRCFPALRGKCHVLDAATPYTYESYTGTAEGSAYGLKQSTAQIALNALTPIRGLYLAGQSVLAPGLLGALISALLAVSHILGEQIVWNEIRQWR